MKRTTFPQLIAGLPARGGPASIFCLHSGRLRAQVRQVLRCLPDPYYAVKANMHPEVLRVLADEGLRKFEFSSLPELDAAQSACPDGTCAFMNTVKSEDGIAIAYQRGVRTFVFDCRDELDKILRATGGAPDCTLIVRLALAPKRSQYDMTGKFGAEPADAATLLKTVNGLGLATGITFHVGSQCEHPESYAEAIAEAAHAVSLAGINLSVLDVGGGFPAAYSGGEPPLEQFGRVIDESFAKHAATFGDGCTLRCEPGRSLLAVGGSVLVRVELRRGNTLYLSDGLHGLLSELRWFSGLHPVRRVRPANPAHDALGDFSFAGPTCDSGDLMKGPYRLPSDMAMGDWIEVGCLGAYSLELATPFNGFGRYDLALIQTDDEGAYEKK